jgi:uncharacterized protein (DUF58 family)
MIASARPYRDHPDLKQEPFRRRLRLWGLLPASLLGLRLTFYGTLFLAILVIILLAALTSEANLLMLLFGIAVGVLCFNALAVWRAVQRLDVDRIAPQAVVAGRPFTIVYTVRNRRRWFRTYSLIISESKPIHRQVQLPQGYIQSLRPRERWRVELMARCFQRGKLELPAVRVSSRFPLGLVSCSVEYPAGTSIAIYPTVGRLRRNLWTDHQATDSPTIRSGQDRGGQEEFHGLREYREGDNPRWVHWRRSARTGELLVREHIELRTTQMIIVLDPWPQDGGEQRRRSLLDPLSSVGRIAARSAEPIPERIISAAATAICDGLERNHRVGLICRAGASIAIAPAGGRPHRERLLYELSRICQGDAVPLDELVGRVRWSMAWNARCLLCTSRFLPVHDQVRRMLSQRAERTTVVTPERGGLEALFEIDLYDV